MTRHGKRVARHDESQLHPGFERGRFVLDHPPAATAGNLSRKIMSCRIDRPPPLTIDFKNVFFGRP